MLFFYKSMSKIIKVYKSAGKYIIELDVDIFIGHNNLNRKVMDSNYAKYRCDRAYVNRIYNKFTKDEIKSIQSDHNNNFIYQTGQIVTVSDYDTNNDNICARGIHFYLSEQAAYYHNINEGSIDGEYKYWDCNGQLAKKCKYVNNKREGLYEIWNKYGQLIIRYNFIDGQREGVCEKWYDNGQSKEVCNYVNGWINGSYNEWYENGQLKIVSEYINGKINGLYKEWYENGQLKIKCRYISNVMNGCHKFWNENGKLSSKCHYTNGLINDLSNDDLKKDTELK